MSRQCSGWQVNSSTWCRCAASNRARFLQQVGIREAADEPQLLARAEAQLLQLTALGGAAPVDARERGGRKLRIHLNGGAGHQQRQVVLHARLQGRLQPRKRGLAL
jgi:hypothetical protein